MLHCWILALTFDTFTKLDANIDVVSSNSAAVEARRVANIAGAVSSVLTSDLTASRAVETNGSGKLAAILSLQQNLENCLVLPPALQN